MESSEDQRSDEVSKLAKMSLDDIKAELVQHQKTLKNMKMVGPLMSGNSKTGFNYNFL